MTSVISSPVSVSYSSSACASVSKSFFFSVRIFRAAS
jgi:hypothetical protein